MFYCFPLYERLDEAPRRHENIVPFRLTPRPHASGIRHVLHFWSAARPRAALEFLECGAPRAALIYFGLRQFIAALDSRRVPAPL